MAPRDRCAAAGDAIARRCFPAERPRRPGARRPAATARMSARRTCRRDEARALMGPDAMLGVTCKGSRDLAMQAGEDGADYVAFGAFFPSGTKDVTRFIDPEILHWWSELMELPCCAIGGITAENCAPLVQAGRGFPRGGWLHLEPSRRAGGGRQGTEHGHRRRLTARRPGFPIGATNVRYPSTEPRWQSKSQQKSARRASCSPPPRCSPCCAPSLRQRPS